MQRPRKSRLNRLKLSEVGKKGPGLKKINSDSTIDEGYSSGNPPPPPTTTTTTTLTTKLPRKPVTEKDAKDPKSVSDMSKPNPKPNATASKPKLLPDSKTVNPGRHSNYRSVRPGTEHSVRPKPLTRSESRTFVFVYDEDAKTSKAVAAPDNLNVEVPVLLQYELTEDALEKCLETSDYGAGNAKADDNNNADGNGANDNFCSPTESLLLSREKDELKNRGLHVVKWLINLKESNDDCDSNDDTGDKNGDKEIAS